MTRVGSGPPHPASRCVPRIDKTPYPQGGEGPAPQNPALHLLSDGLSEQSLPYDCRRDTGVGTSLLFLSTKIVDDMGIILCIARASRWYHTVPAACTIFRLSLLYIFMQLHLLRTIYFYPQDTGAGRY